MNRTRAKFITFEGIDGCGKSTLISELARWLDRLSVPYMLTREPGGTHLGENIRKLLLDPSYKNMNQRAEVLLYTASRAQLTAEVILPALGAGAWVLADRYTDATLAYQGYGRGLPLNPLRKIQEWATDCLRPDRTVLLDCDVQIAFERRNGRNGEPDRIERENRSFHEKVRAGYLELARSEPQRFIVLDAARPLDEVIAEFRSAFHPLLPPV